MRLVTLLEVLDSTYGREIWQELELETLVHDLIQTKKYPSDNPELLLDKLGVLFALVHSDTQIFFEDPYFAMYASLVINNSTVDFDRLTIPMTLELAYAIVEVKALEEKLPNTVIKIGDAFIKAVGYLLRNEGYSKPLSPFNFVPEAELVPGQLEEDTNAKALAIAKYLTHMRETDV